MTTEYPGKQSHQGDRPARGACPPRPESFGSGPPRPPRRRSGSIRHSLPSPHRTFRSDCHPDCLDVVDRFRFVGIRVRGGQMSADWKFPRWLVSALKTSQYQRCAASTSVASGVWPSKGEAQSRTVGTGNPSQLFVRHLMWSNLQKCDGTSVPAGRVCFGRFSESRPVSRVALPQPVRRHPKSTGGLLESCEKPSGESSGNGKRVRSPQTEAGLKGQGKGCPTAEAGILTVDRWMLARRCNHTCFSPGP